MNKEQLLVYENIKSDLKQVQNEIDYVKECLWLHK